MDFGTNPYDVAWLALAPLAALASLRVVRPLHVALVVAATALVAWGSGFAALGWLDAQWSSYLAGTQNPSPRLMEQLNADGASATAVLVLGLPVSLIYVLVCFASVRGVRRLKQKRKLRASRSDGAG